MVASLLLTPKGKVESSFRLVRVGDDAWLDVEAGFGEALRAALERFKLRVKVEIAGPTEPWGMVAVRDGAVDRCGRAGDCHCASGGVADRAAWT